MEIETNMEDISIPVKDDDAVSTSSQRRRRWSTSSHRGRRSSSKKQHMYTPHSEIDTNQLYRLIPQDLPEPQRMRALLVWVGSRSLKTVDENPKTPQELEELAVHMIQKDLLMAIRHGKVSTSWYHNDLPHEEGKKRHPINEHNRLRVEELKEQIAKLKKENQEWNQVLKQSVAEHSQQLSFGQESIEKVLEGLKPQELEFMKELESFPFISSQEDVYDSIAHCAERVSSLKSAIKESKDIEKQNQQKLYEKIVQQFRVPSKSEVFNLFALLKK